MNFCLMAKKTGGQQKNGGQTDCGHEILPRALSILPDL
jgi:hypothetical protein